MWESRWQSAINRGPQIMLKRFTLWMVVLTFLVVSAQAQTPQTAQAAQELEAGKPIEREIAGGESHAYQISLTAGQFVRFHLEQRTVEAALTLSAPDGKQLVEMNLTRFGAEESLSLEATITGNYKLTVKGVGLASVRGAYGLMAAVQPTTTA